MISDMLTIIPGGTTFQIIAFLIFFPVFIGVLIWVFRANKDYLKKMSRLPLESDRLVNGKIGE